jgi:hypothetical protein
MKKVLGLICGLLLLASVPAFSADIDGKWSGSVDTPNGPIDVHYTFKAEGTKLTGSTTNAMDNSEIPLKNGKIDGDKVAFSLDIDFGAGPTTFNYTGVLSGKDLKLHSEFMGMPIDFTLKKG